MLKLFGIAMLLATAFSAISCSNYNLDEDGDGYFYMIGDSNSHDSYDYIFLNKSNYEVTVTVASSTKKLKAKSIVATTITDGSNRTKVKYSPTDKVKPESSWGTIHFRNK